MRQRCCRYAGGGTFPGLTGSGGAGEDLPYHCSRPLDWLSRVGERPRGVTAVAAAAAAAAAATGPTPHCPQGAPTPPLSGKGAGGSIAGIACRHHGMPPPPA